jgi:hypothetical protein
MGDKKPMIIPGKGRVLTIAEAEELRRMAEARPPAHVDPTPTIAPGTLRVEWCENCGLPCRPNPDGLCDGCVDDADGGCDGPEENIGDDPSPEDE